MISDNSPHRSLKIRVTPAAKAGLLNFSKRVDYAFLLLVELAKRTGEGQLSLRMIADENRMSFYFLQKVALELRRAGLIQAGRGKNGGYSLARAASDISLKEILEATEGPMAIMSCLHDENAAPNCVRESWCSVRPGLQFINKTIANTLGQTTLNDFINPTLWKRQHRAVTR